MEGVYFNLRSSIQSEDSIKERTLIQRIWLMLQMLYLFILLRFSKPIYSLPEHLDSICMSRCILVISKVGTCTLGRSAFTNYVDKTR